MTTTAPNADPHLEVRLDYLDYLDYLGAHFLRLAYQEGLMTIVGSDWTTLSELDAAPGEELGRASYFHDASDESVVRLPVGLCHLILRDRSLSVRVAATDSPAADAALAALERSLPEVGQADGSTPVSFWWWSDVGARKMARMLKTPAWADISENYPVPTRQRLSELSDWEAEPPNGGRLILLHGEPGTGKTNAVRSLSGRWRAWADLHFVTDPRSSWPTRAICSRQSADRVATVGRSTAGGSSCSRTPASTSLSMPGSPTVKRSPACSTSAMGCSGSQCEYSS